jgi:hypothetical protein
VKNKAKIHVEQLMEDSADWFFGLPVDVQQKLQQDWMLAMYMGAKKIKKSQVDW